MNRSSICCLAAFLFFSAAPAEALPPARTQSAGGAATPLAPAARKSVIEAMIDELNARYVFPKKVPEIAKQLPRRAAAGKYDGLTDPRIFATAVNADIEAVANDRHLRLMWSPEPFPPLPEAGIVDPVRQKVQDEFLLRKNYWIAKVEILDGDIGYLKIDGFAPPEDAGATLAAAMAFLKHADALIIDLRDNGGGDPQTVAIAMSYLVPPETLINTFRQRDKPVDDQIWSLPYVDGGRWSVDKPVFVLTSADTASGGEEMAYDIQQLKRGAVVGQKTWGGANPGDVIPLDAHFAVFVPTGMAVNPISKTNWEGAGVKPDVATQSAGALDTAQRLALGALVAKATGPRRGELETLLERANRAKGPSTPTAPE